MLTPPTIEIPQTQSDDVRIGHLLGLSEDSPAVVLIGFPSDRGVALSGGRPGAAEGPDAIRRAFYRMTPGSAGIGGLFAHVQDVGDVDVTGDVAQDQESLAEVLSPLLRSNTVCVVLGGGHETAYGHYLGYVANDVAPGIINWDAHTDVRKPLDGQPTSGSSFYLALHHGTHPTPSYTAGGLQPQLVSDGHLSLMKKLSCNRVWADEVDGAAIDDLYSDASDPTMVSFDLDAIDQAFAPGVSAPTASGLSTKIWYHAAYAAGISNAVASIDICELNPKLDVDNRTARVAALTLWHFMSGFAARVGLKRFVRSR